MSKKDKLDLEAYTKKHGKADIERLGVFVEMPYMNGKGYVSPFPKPKLDKGRGILPEGRKSKTATQHGYFDDTYKRIYAGEAIDWKRRRKTEKLLGGPWHPPGCTHDGFAGDFHNTFTGIVSSWSPLKKKEKKKAAATLRNALTSPGKKGGFGYVDTCLSKYPEHRPEPYVPRKSKKKLPQPLGPPMKTAHCPQPCFWLNPWKQDKPGPTYKPPKPKLAKVVGDGRWIPNGPVGLKKMEYVSERSVARSRGAGKKKALLPKELYGLYSPQSHATKSLFTTSVLNARVDVGLNATTYKNYEPRYCKHLL